MVLAKKHGADYVFFVDTSMRLTNNQTLINLIAQVLMPVAA